QRRLPQVPALEIAASKEVARGFSPRLRRRSKSNVRPALAAVPRTGRDARCGQMAAQTWFRSEIDTSFPARRRAPALQNGFGQQPLTAKATTSRRAPKHRAACPLPETCIFLALPSLMTLTAEQKQAVASWVAAGDNLSVIQKKLGDEFKISMTY